MPERVQLLIELAYRGERFFGVAPQRGLPTVHAALAARLWAAAGQAPRRLVFAARTDRGVHARHNVATCYFWDPPPADVLLPRLTAARDDGLSELRVRPVDKHVFARAAATGKHYRYRILDGAGGEQPDAWCLPERLDLAALRRAVRDFVGRHDFSSVRARACQAPDPVKEIFSATVDADGGSPSRALTIDLRGSGFLRHMVRIIVGTLVDVGRGVRDPTTVPLILAARDRDAAGPMAPPQGLTLWRVELRGS